MEPGAAVAGGDTGDAGLGEEVGGMKLWTLEEDALFAELYPTHTAPQIAEILGRSLPSIDNRRHTLGLRKEGNSGRFTPGIASWNKGRNFVSGGRSVETQFKPGHKPHTWNPIGHERVTNEGYLQRKITDTGVTRHDYKNVHHMVWLEAGREIPKGFRLVFRNGNRADIRLDNLELVSIADMMRKNSIHNYPKQIAQLVQLRGALVRKINNRRKKHAEEKHD